MGAAQQKTENTNERFFEDIRFPIQITWNKKLDERRPVSIQDERHAQIELKYFLAGDVEIRCGTGVYQVGSGDIFIVNPWETHATTRVIGEPEYHLFMIDRNLLASQGKDLLSIKYIEPFIEGCVKFNNLVHPDAQLVGVVEQLLQEMRQRSDCYELAVKGLLFSLLTCLFRSHVSEIIDPARLGFIRRYGDRLKPAFDYIDTHYAQEIRIGTLAQCCNMSTKYFCRVFKLFAGVGAISYVNNFRLGKAKSLLKNSDKSINEIAQETGFRDVNYFCRRFRLETGENSLRYRRK